MLRISDATGPDQVVDVGGGPQVCELVVDEWRVGDSQQGQAGGVVPHVKMPANVDPCLTEECPRTWGSAGLDPDALADVG